ncbi:MAG TPA: hypothetical protein VIV11_40600 [Kofleriaceae bacterium]
MKRLCLMLGLAVAVAVACGGAQKKVVINTPQDYETVVGQLIDEVIGIFRDAGINCEMITADLRSMKTSPKLTAAKEYRAAHPEAKEITVQKIEARRAEIEKAAGPGMRQCSVNLQSVNESLTE